MRFHKNTWIYIFQIFKFGKNQKVQKKTKLRRIFTKFRKILLAWKNSDFQQNYFLNVFKDSTRLYSRKPDVEL